MRVLNKPENLKSAVKFVIASNRKDGYQPSRFANLTENGDAENLLEICERVVKKGETLDPLMDAVSKIPTLLTLEDFIKYFGKELGFSDECIEVSDARVAIFNRLANDIRYSFATSIINIGLMPYLNSVLFYRAMTPDKFNLVAFPPRAMTQAAAEGKLDAGPITVVGGMTLERDFEPLGEFCIATKDKARSILLFSKVKIEELSGKKVGITDETSTAEQLLKVLLKHKYNLTNVAYVSLDSPNDAYLLIGDSALKNRRGVAGYPHVYDLGEVWNAWTGLSFVFATWIARKSLPQAQKEALCTAIQTSLNMAPDYKRFAGERKHLGMSESEVREYLEGFNFVMGEQERKALKLFKSRIFEETL